MVVSLALHAILLVVALSFVAVTVVTKDDNQFEAKPVKRPKMQPKKLQVPVKMKKKRPKPKLRKQITVKSRMDRKMPEIKMPEIKGIRSGLGAAEGAGLGGAAGVGFSMPEIEVFGVKSKGEKVFIALDTDAYIMRDEVGGKSAYAIIKQELIRVVEQLGPTTLFNLAVYDHGGASILFPTLVPATRENAAKVKRWLEPLNKPQVGTTGTYGRKTLGEGGTTIQMTPAMKANLKGSGAENWFRPLAEAMVDQADTVFLLTGWWGVLRWADEPAAEWKESNKKKWYEYVGKAREKQKEESERRAARGEPEQIFRDDWHLISHYFPDQHAQYHRPQPAWQYFTAKDYVEAIKRVRKESSPKIPMKSGLAKKKDKFSVNVIFFAPKDDPSNHDNFKTLANRSHGNFRLIKGLDAIQDAASHKTE
jgi:hypothetical protein